MKLGTDTHLGWGTIPIHFGVTGVIFRVKQSILWSLGSILGSQKPGTNTCLGSGKMSIHVGFTGVNVGVTRVNFGVTGARWKDAYSFWGQFWGHPLRYYISQSFLTTFQLCFSSIFCSITGISLFMYLQSRFSWYHALIFDIQDFFQLP